MTTRQNEKIAERKLSEALESLHKYNFQTTNPVKKQYNFEFDVLSGDEKIKILIYFGKKGVKTVVQGNQNSPLYSEISDLVTGNLSLNFFEEELKEPEEYIGSDETGKGDVFGPIVTCAVYVDSNTIKDFRKIGVQDSKNLSINQIIKIAKEITKIAKVNFEIISINPQRYNELYNKFRNINEILNWSHTKAIENLLKRKPAKTIITDKFRKKDLKFSQALPSNDYNFIQEPKAEKFTAVAAASILAKSKQIDWFASQKRNGLDLKRGASDEVKNQVEEFLRKHSKQELENIAKIHFKTVQNLI